MKTYNSLNDFAIEKYLSLSFLLEDTISRWDDFVCNFFGWDSYYFNTSYHSYLNTTKPLKETLEENITKWFDVKFNKNGIKLINKNLEMALS